MTTTERFEAARRRDAKRLTLTELEAFAAMLRITLKSVDQAATYERASKQHPAALKYEEIASDQFDAAIIYLANLRMRVEPGPIMNAAGEVSGS